MTQQKKVKFYLSQLSRWMFLLSDSFLSLNRTAVIVLLLTVLFISSRITCLCGECNVSTNLM